MNKLLEINHFTKYYNKDLILDDISFEINSGEIVGLIGRNGSGKTTLMKGILGLIHIDEGQIFFEGKENYQEDKSLMSSIGYLLDCKLFEYLNAYDNIAIQEKYNGTHINKGDLKQKIEKILDFVELKNDKKKVKEYSFGMKQRLGLALALLGETKLLILDEPFVGLDPIGIGKFKEFIYKISKEKGVSILISSHQLSEIESMCVRYLFISEKKMEKYVDSKDKKIYLRVKKCTPNFITQIKTIGIEITIQDDVVSFVYDENKLNKILYLIYQENMEIADIDISKTQINELFYGKE